MTTGNQNLKVFITGVTGYLGGPVADKLIKNGYKVSGLVRTEDTGKIELLKERGIKPVIGSLDNVEILSKAATEADVIIHTANVDHVSVYTLVAALEHTGKTLITTTGSSIVTDHADGEYAGTIFHTEDTYFVPVPFRRPQ